MNDAIPFVIGSTLTLVLIGVVTTFSTVYRNSHQIKILTGRVEKILQNMMMSDIVSMQVHMNATAGPQTLRNMDMVSPLSKVMLHEMSLGELRTMAFLLEPQLNGDVIWDAGKTTAVRTLLEVMGRKKRLPDVMQYIRDNRKDIEI